MDASLPPTSISLSETVVYAPGSVVSKTLLQNDGGNVTLFAFDAGQGLSEHTSPYAALVHMLEGTAVWMVDGTEVTAQVGEAVMLPASVPHAVTAKEPFKMVLIMLRG